MCTLCSIAVSDETISKSLTGLAKSIQKVQDELRHHEVAKEKEDMFYVKMQEFANGAMAMLKVFQGQYAKLQDIIKSLAGYYCIDLKKAPMEEVFTDISTFLENFKVGSCTYIWCTCSVIADNVLSVVMIPFGLTCQCAGWDLVCLTMTFFAQEIYLLLLTLYPLSFTASTS